MRFLGCWDLGFKVLGFQDFVLRLMGYWDLGRGVWGSGVEDFGILRFGAEGLGFSHTGYGVSG